MRTHKGIVGEADNIDATTATSAGTKQCMSRLDSMCMQLSLIFADKVTTAQLKDAGAAAAIITMTSNRCSAIWERDDMRHQYDHNGKQANMITYIVTISILGCTEVHFIHMRVIKYHEFLNQMCKELHAKTKQKGKPD